MYCFVFNTEFNFRRRRLQYFSEAFNVSRLGCVANEQIFQGKFVRIR